MPAPSQFVTKEQLQDFSRRLVELNKNFQDAIARMDQSGLDHIFVAGKPTADLSIERIHAFVSNAIGEAFNPTVASKSQVKSPVEEKLDQANKALKRSTKSKK